MVSMTIPLKKENEVLWMNEVDGILSRLIKFAQGNIIVVQQCRDGVWGTKGIFDTELQAIWNSIRSANLPSTNG